jgi:hypothetical protein
MGLVGRTCRGDQRLTAAIRVDARERFRRVDGRGFSLPTAYRFATNVMALTAVRKNVESFCISKRVQCDLRHRSLGRNRAARWTK